MRAAGPAGGGRGALVAQQPPRRLAAFAPGRIYLGWQHALLQPPPGPMPRQPPVPEPEQVSPAWVAAQQREDRRLARPRRQAQAAAALLAGAAAALWQAGLVNAWLGAFGVAGALAIGSAAAVAGSRARRDLRARIEAERRRVAQLRAAQQARHAARQEQHARSSRLWQQRRAAFDRQPQWYAVSLPADIHRVDIAGGTLSGWSAMLTMIAAPRLDAGGEVTVLDLTEAAVAADLVAAARGSGISPLVWVIPGDLPRLDLGTGLGSQALADVLATAVSASGEGASAGDEARDAAILERILDALGGSAAIASITAALRALAQVGDPREDLRRGLLTADQLQRISTLFGRAAAERVVMERAWALESRLRRLDALGAAPVSLRPSRLRVAWLDRRSAALGHAMLATYLTVAMTHVLRQASPGRPWQHTLCVLGAERLGGAVIDRLCDACEITGTGLVIGYRSIPAPVRERLGRGNAAVAFMRLGNGEDARAASEQIGTEHRFVLSQLTDTVGTTLSDTIGDSYTSTVGTADSVSDSVSDSVTEGRSRGRGRSRHGAFAPFADITGTASRDSSYSAGRSDSVSVTEGINSSTSWGLSTSWALSVNSSLAATAQRSREVLVEPHQLQQLPPSAVIVTYAGPAGRRVVLADANPAIITLPTATLSSLEEARAAAWRMPGAGA